ncbi:AAA family ATPase [Sphingomonas sp. CFBP 13603]|uniref:ATP-binding protein n=1 Tax=Sphingomonas sp. CFBP 13603 TaxID=2774040 RepID=UPI001868946A|nr:AAA family ATPase [Sphingomonas sp. CFBP 13603]MBE2992552.1 AAA family ATPase [Sphingomonas sp. CFBP 13603]
MALRVRHLRLRVQTTGGLFGADIGFDGALTVLHAPNTSGKSTCLQALIYALGLEQMLSAKRETPLPFAMRQYIEDPDSGITYNVTESFVAVELENGEGQRITVRRNVVADTDRRLITVVEGPALTEPYSQHEARDYFVHDPGAAKRDAGFHRMLAQFMGWTLPTVKRYDGGDTMLYLETIFPLFYVEQKSGWSSIPAAIPTHFRIRDVAKRSVEFLLALETHALELRRQELELQLGIARTRWSATIDEIRSLTGAQGLRVQQLSQAPTTMQAEIQGAYLQAGHGDEWRNLDALLAELQERLETFDTVAIPNAEGVAVEAAAEVDRVTLEIQEINRERNDIFRGRQAELVQRQSTMTRIAQIDEDLKKNQDALKLQNYGSKASVDLSPHHCPTCEQPLMDALLPQGTIEPLMSLDDNIEFLSAQRAIFKRLVGRSDVVIKELDLDLLSTGDDVRQKSARLRALKSDLIAPAHAASASVIEERLRLDARIQRLSTVRDHFDGLVSQLIGQAEIYGGLLAAQAELPRDRLSDADRDKLRLFERSIREQLGRYGFKTFAPKELEISEDTYRPQKEGFEIGFELSASDAIRLKWAYQLGFLDVGLQTITHHPGILVLDEPRQQEAAEASVNGLLRTAALLAEKGSQILIATSEQLANVKQFVAELPCQLLTFDGPIIRRLDAEATMN